MKKILSLLTLCLLFTAFTSCSDDDKEEVRSTLTKEERAAQLRDMEGSYAGKLYFNYADYTQKAKDSAAITATITATDSLIKVEGMPLRIIANRIDKDYAKNLDSTAMMPTLEANLQMYIPYGYSVEDAEYMHWFKFVPAGKDYESSFPVMYGGQEHTMTVSYGTNYSSIASNGASLFKRTEFNFIISAVSLDGVFTKQYINEVLLARIIKQ